MRNTRFLFGIILVFLLAAIAAPVTFAQGITGDKVVLGDNYVLRDGETLDGNLTVLGGTAEVESGATVAGDMSVLGGAATIDGAVTGDVSVLGGSLRLGESAVIEGNLATLAGSIQRAPEAVVRGNTFNGLRTPSEISPASVVPSIETETPRSWFGRFLTWQLGTIGAILLMGLLGLVLVLVAPRAVERIASATDVQPAVAFGAGFLTLVVGFLAGAILLIACGLGLLVWLALAAGSILGWIGISLWFGRRVLRGLKTRSSSSIIEVLVGVILITLLSRLPCIGWLFWAIFVSLGLGAVVLTRFGSQDADRTFRSASLPPPPRGDGTGGDFAPLPETSDVDPMAPVVVTPTVAASPAGFDVVTPEHAMPLTAISGIDSTVANRLQAAGIHTVADLAASNPVELAAATGVSVGQIMTENWIGQAQQFV